MTLRPFTFIAWLVAAFWAGVFLHESRRPHSQGQRVACRIGQRLVVTHVPGSLLAAECAP